MSTSLDQAKLSREKFTYVPIRPELLGILIRKMQKIRKFLYAHQSPTAPLNAMEITMAKVKKLKNQFLTEVFIGV